VPGLNEIIGVFKGFFSRAFWFGSFLPVAIFGFIHLAIAWWVLPDVPLAEWAKANASTLTYFPVTFAALIVLAYALTPLVPLARGLLDGSLLPERWHDALRSEHMTTARAVRRKINEAFALFNELGYLNSKQIADIWTARGRGNAAGGITDEAAIDQATRAIGTLQRRFDTGDLPGKDALKDGVDKLVAALQINATELPAGPAPTAAQRNAAQRLDAAQLQLVELLKDAEADAEHRYHALETRHSRLAYDNPQATRMADTRVLMESYPAKAYGVDFAYIWPRLQLVIPQQAAQGEGASFGEKLAAARSQIDFAVLSLALALTIPLIWLPYLAWTADNPTKFLVIGAAAPLVAAFFYHVAVESQIAFGEVMKTAIDSHRLKLLSDNLRQPLPATLSAERELWGRLQGIDQVRAYELVYRHPKTPSS
jgi:hypothetical protein